MKLKKLKKLKSLFGPDEPILTMAWIRGREDLRNEVDPDKAPYEWGTEVWKAWRLGWLDEFEISLAEMDEEVAGLSFEEYMNQ